MLLQVRVDDDRVSELAWRDGATALRQPTGACKRAGESRRRTTVRDAFPGQPQCGEDGTMDKNNDRSGGLVTLNDNGDE